MPRYACRGFKQSKLKIGSVYTHFMTPFIQNFPMFALLSNFMFSHLVKEVHFIESDFFKMRFCTILTFNRSFFHFVIYGYLKYFFFFNYIFINIPKTVLCYNPCPILAGEHLFRALDMFL